MAVSIQDIKKLRTLTGAGMMDVKKALEEALGDFEKAIELIRKRGQAIAAKRSDREAEEGCVLAASRAGVAMLVGVKCETDFVARNQDFVEMTQSILALAMDNNFSSKEELLAATLPTGITVADTIAERSGVTGEKMELHFYERVEGVKSVSYIHPGNMLASIVAFNEEIDDQVARDVAMQIAAMNPIGITEADVPEEIKERELTIARDKARDAGKPEAILDRIAEGALQKYFKENTLLDQEFIKDNKLTIRQYLANQSKTLEVVAFKRATMKAE